MDTTIKKSLLRKVLDQNYIEVLFNTQLCQYFDFGSIKKVYIPRVFFKDETFVIQYEVFFEYSKTKVVMFGKMYMNLSEYELSKNKNSSKNVFILDECQTLFYVFPFDPRLHLLQYFENNNEKLILHDLLQNNDMSKISNWELLGYRLEKRAVLRINYESDNKFKDSSAVIKLCRKNKIKSIVKRFDTLLENGFAPQNSSGFDIPQLKEYSSTTGVLMMEDVIGQTVHDMIGDSQFGICCELAARILKKLHEIPISDLSEHTYLDEIKNLQTNLSYTKYFIPHLEEKIEQSIEQLVNTEDIVSHNTYCYIHKDFYDKQIIYSSRRTTLIDFDSLSIGDPALDYGNFTAHLKLRKLQNPSFSASVKVGKQKFEHMYEPTESFLQRAKWWEKATLIRLAMLYSFRPRWNRLPDVLVTSSLG